MAAAPDFLWHDRDDPEQRLRALITERLAARPPPVLDDQVVASYFLVLRSWTLPHAAREVSYHATSGTKESRMRENRPSGSEGGGAVTPLSLPLSSRAAA